MFVYLDDLLIISATVEQHLILLEEVARLLDATGLTVNVEKSHFLFKEVKFLGFVGGGKLRIDQNKVDAVVSLTPRQVRRFISVVHFLFSTT